MELKVYFDVYTFNRVLLHCSIAEDASGQNNELTEDVNENILIRKLKNGSRYRGPLSAKGTNSNRDVEDMNRSYQARRLQIFTERLQKKDDRK